MSSHRSYTFSASSQVGKNIGTAQGSWNAIERGNDYNHVTVLELGSATEWIAPSGAVDLANGIPIYTFPTARFYMDRVFVDLTCTTEGTVDTDTPQYGIGSVVGSGSVSVLTGTSTFHDIGGTGAFAAVTTREQDVIQNSTALENVTNTSVTAYLNIADGWAGADTVTLSAGSKIVIVWTYLGNHA